MKMKICGILALFGLLLISTGCVSTVNGRTKAGLPSKDRIYSRYERSVPQILNAARTVLKRNGQIESDDTVANALHGKVNKRDIWVRASEVDNKISEVVVQARKSGLGDIELASELSKQIALELAANQ